VVLATAKQIYADDGAGIAALREVIACLPHNARLPAPGLSGKQWTALGRRFTSRFLRAADPDLAPTDRMRYLTVTAEASIPSASTTGRVRFLPQMFWPEPAGRLLPVTGFAPELFRAVMSVCVLIPGSVERKHAGFKTALNPRLNNTHISLALQGFDDLPGSSALKPVLQYLCRLAAYLDDNGAPIDYQRRREQIPAEPIDWDRWHDLACAADAHPGEHGPTGRLLHVQRHLHQLLSGADLADPRHPLAFRDARDRSRTVTYTTAMPPTLRTALNEYAAELLADLGIDEPVAWSPPGELTHGLNLPGIDVDRLDAGKLRRILIEEQRPARQAAEILGTHVEHVRLAMEHLDRPARNWGPQAAPAAWRREQEAAQVLTRELLEREYVTARRSLAEIGQATGIPKRTVARRARALGIPIAPAAPRTVGIDEAWLREQYMAKNRSTADIATEIGASPMTVNRTLEQMGIPRRPAGIDSHPHNLAKIDRRYPADIRAAVEGGLHGWHRLNRFQIAMAFPSLETAARFLGADQSTLVRQLQRLEADIGSTLFVRGAFARPHQPTARGRRLLNALARPHIKALMETGLAERRHEFPDQAALEKAAIDSATRNPPGPLQPFDGIEAQRITITAATKTLLRDLIDRGTERTYGQEITTRTGLDSGTVYPNLRRLLAAGWLTSWPEDEQEWLAGAPPGCGPGRRRTYYALTDNGRRAALHEIERRSRVRGNNKVL
jgi:DNA-binding MarR family transcriptional regulator